MTARVAIPKERKVAKHFGLTTEDTTFAFMRETGARRLLRAAYLRVARTLDAAATVLAYKSLAHVERAFAQLDRPRHPPRPPSARQPGAEGRVSLYDGLRRGLACARSWRPCCLEDHDRKAAAAFRPSPVARTKVRRSPRQAAHPKDRTRRDGAQFQMHSFRTLIADLATLTRDTMPFGDKLPMTVLSRPTPMATGL